jgi:hypothetical protein
LYPIQFTPPEYFVRNSSTTFLLSCPDGDAAWDKVSGLTLNRNATSGQIETINEMVTLFDDITIPSYSSESECANANNQRNRLFNNFGVLSYYPGLRSYGFANSYGSYMGYPDPNQFQLGSGDFTLEMWVRASSLPTLGSFENK